MMTLSNQESGKYLDSRGRFDLVKSSGVGVKHTRTLNNTCAFVNEYERAQQTCQVYFQ